MAEITEKNEKDVKNEPANPVCPTCGCEEENWRAQFKRVFLAGLGAVALAEDEMEKLIHKMIERGTVAESEGRKWLKDIVNKRYQNTKDKVHDIETSIGKSGLDNLEAILAKLNIPTKAQFEELTKKVEALSSRIEELSKKLPQ